MICLEASLVICRGTRLQTTKSFWTMQKRMEQRLIETKIIFQLSTTILKCLENVNELFY